MAPLFFPADTKKTWQGKQSDEAKNKISTTSCEQAPLISPMPSFSYQNVEVIPTNTRTGLMLRNAEQFPRVLSIQSLPWAIAGVQYFYGGAQYPQGWGSCRGVHISHLLPAQHICSLKMLLYPLPSHSLFFWWPLNVQIKRILSVQK